MESKSHKDKFTGIYDRNGIPINNGDDVLVHHYNRYQKHAYKFTFASFNICDFILSSLLLCKYITNNWIVQTF